MEDDLDAGGLDYLVKGVLSRDIRDDLDVEGLLAEVLVGVPDLLGLVLRTDSGDDPVALLKELLEDVG